MKICRVLAFISIILQSCIQHTGSFREDTDIETRKVNLDFSKCVTALEEYDRIQVEVPKRYNRDKSVNEGMCEYNFTYKDSSVLYISTNVWFGSRLNMENRYNINHQAYRRENLRDTIEISGIQKNGELWREVIIGDVLFGYLNVPESKKELFDEVLNSIEKY